MKKWAKNGFQTGDGNLVANRDLIAKLQQLIERPGEIHWVS